MIGFVDSDVGLSCLRRGMLTCSLSMRCGIYIGVFMYVYLFLFLFFHVVDEGNGMSWG